jgi:RimJ/RimL family protein N-acetyltransferase
VRNLSLDDLALYEAIYGDPEMWRELGGLPPQEGLEEKLRRDVASTEAGETWVLVIVPDELPGTAAGSVSIWEHTWEGQTITEIGWMVLPRFQGRGLGTEAVRVVLARARSEGRWDVVHAFPSVTNVRSNAMSRKLGFSLVEELDLVRYRTLRCNHWRLDLRPPTPARRENPSRRNALPGMIRHPVSRVTVGHTPESARSACTCLGPPGFRSRWCR